MPVNEFVNDLCSFVFNLDYDLIRIFRNTLVLTVSNDTTEQLKSQHKDTQLLNVDTKNTNTIELKY